MLSSYDSHKQKPENHFNPRTFENDPSARLRPRVTFDLLTMDHLCQLVSKSVHSFSKYCIHKVGNRQTNGRMDRQLENTMHQPGSLAWWSLAVCSLAWWSLAVEAWWKHEKTVNYNLSPYYADLLRANIAT